MGRWLTIVLVGLAVAVGGGFLWLNQANNYQTDGSLGLSMLTAPVVVTRDARGAAHIAAENRRDMLRAQGFITAQDRLFQMEFFRMLAWGRLSELIGEEGIQSDTQMRVLGLPRNAQRMAKQFSPEVSQFLQDFLDGVNTYIASQQDEFPLELSLMGHQPMPWTLEDSAIILHYVSLMHSVNMKAEAVALALIDTVGPDMARTLMSINVNPDRTPEAMPVEFIDPKENEAYGEVALNRGRSTTPIAPSALHEQLAPLHLGSNNWAVGPTRSASGAATVVNDPHLDARLLPGVWYPISFSTPDFHATGVALPGIPGMMVGRTDKVAYGVTNAYGDVQDLFLETLAPGSQSHYLEGETPFAFDVREETITIKDKNAKGGFREKVITVRSTHRGPVISDHGIVNLGDRVVSLKWGASETYGPEIGYDKLFFARSAQEVDAAIQLIDIHMFNFVFADVDGNFGRRATGKIPVRRVGEGAIPVAVTDSEAYWTSWIPKDQLPGEFNPERGWTGTANHDTRPTDYPFTYSTYFSPSYRYRRLAQLMNSHEKISNDQHWAFMHDIKNLQAATVLPVLLPLLREAGYSGMAELLATWSHDDAAEQRAPLVYQALYSELAMATFEDELGSPLAGEMLSNWYFWQERFDAMVLMGQSDWFDDVRSDSTETLVDMVGVAAAAAQKKLSQFAEDTRWGDVHRLTFVSPMRQSGFGAQWVGGGRFPMSGSGETLRRARYHFDKPYDTAFFASYNLVSDMASKNHVLSALPGGVAARIFHQHYDSQISSWHAEQATKTPLTRKAAQDTGKTRLVLSPVGG